MDEFKFIFGAISFLILFGAGACISLSFKDNLFIAFGIWSLLSVIGGLIWLYMSKQGE